MFILGGGKQRKEGLARGAGGEGAQKFEDLNMRGLNSFEGVSEGEPLSY